MKTDWLTTEAARRAVEDRDEALLTEILACASICLRWTWTQAPRHALEALCEVADERLAQLIAEHAERPGLELRIESGGALVTGEVFGVELVATLDQEHTNNLVAMIADTYNDSRPLLAQALGAHFTAQLKAHMTARLT